MKLFFVTSFKGGTGRSVAALNLAYHLYSKGRRVMLLDLDLFAPSLLNICNMVDPRRPSVKSDIDRYSTLKGQLTISNFLQTGQLDPLAIYRENLTGKGRRLYDKKIRGNGTVWLYPSDVVDALSDEEVTDEVPIQYSQIPSRLDEFLETIQNEADFVICDLSSGVSPLTKALLDDRGGHLLNHKPTWLVFCRITPQQVSGLTRLLDEVATPRETPTTSSTATNEEPRRVKVIETAQPTERQQRDIDALFSAVNHRTEAIKERLRGRLNIQFADALPFETALLLIEGIIVSGYPYHEAMQNLAVKLIREQE